MRLMGNPVGRMAPKANWAQTNTNMADYIRNKPDLSGFALQADLESVRGQAVANREDLDNAENDITVLQENVSNIETDIVAIKEDTPDTTLIISGKAADAKATGDAIREVQNTLNVIADWPVAFGTDDTSTDYPGTWYWEKWASGKAVCYGRFDFGSVACTKSWGENGFRESEGMYKTFPAGLFSDIPLHLDISLVTGSGAAFVTQDRGRDITAQQTGRITLSRPSAMTLNGVSLGFEVIGRWKNSDGTGSNLETMLNNIIDLQEQYIGGEAE